MNSIQICAIIFFVLNFLTLTAVAWWPDPEPRLGSTAERRGVFILLSFASLCLLPFSATAVATAFIYF